MLEANAAYERLVGVPLIDLLGKPFWPLTAAASESTGMLSTLTSALDAVGRWRGEISVARTDGQVVPTWISVERSSDTYLAIVRDLSDEVALRRDIARLTSTDPLTGLLNRAGMMSVLAKKLEEAGKIGRHITVLLVDIDCFSHINDTLGPAMGDALLVEMARRLHETGLGVFARTGGDEFAVLISDGTDPLRVSRTLFDCIEPHFDVGGTHLMVTASIGAAVSSEETTGASDVLADADLALHQAKADGRNTIRFFAPHMQRSSVRQLSLRNALREALLKDEMSFVLQPKADLVSGRVLGAEALMRWRHADLGQIPPSEFIPLAEDSGMIHELGEWIIAKSVQAAVQWQSRSKHAISIAVNLTQLQLMRPGLLDLVKSALANARAEANLLEFEVTESAAMSDPEHVVRVLGQLRDLGVGLSIDDFGTGYSSLEWLRRLPVHALKIDRSFVQDINRDKAAASIVMAIVGMARAIGLSTVAEGVERVEQLEFLRQLHCDQYQGYLLLKPQPLPEFMAWWEQLGDSGVARIDADSMVRNAS